MCTVTTSKQLGVEQAVNVAKPYYVPKARVDRLIQLAERVERLPHYTDKKSQLLAMSACAAGIFGAEMGLMTSEDEARVLAVVTRVLWGQERKLRCIEILFTVLFKGHRVHPRMMMQNEALAVMHRLLGRRYDLRQKWRETWELRRLRPQAHIPGPVGTVFKIVAQLGWEWVDPFSVRRAHRPPLSLIETPKQRFQHEVRAGVKLALLMPLAGGRLHPLSTESPQGKPLKDCRRKDMMGIAGEIDYDATTKLLRAGSYRLRGEEVILKSVGEGSGEEYRRRIC